LHSAYYICQTFASQHRWPRGPMARRLTTIQRISGDSGFEPQRGQFFFSPQPLQGRGKCIVCWLKPLPAVSVTKQEAFLWVDSLRLFQGSIDYRVCSASQACSRLSRFIPESLWPAQRVPALLVAAEHKTSICVYQKKPAFHQRRFSSVGRATD
jgi:hypothetical protein